MSIGFDRRINVLDVRDANSAVTAKIPKQAGDVESATWHTTHQHNFALSTESGQVFGYDARNMSKPLFE